MWSQPKKHHLFDDAPAPEAVDGFITTEDSMLTGENGFEATPLLTIGDTLDNGYQPVGVLDGMGATKIDDSTVRVFVNHELGPTDGYAYSVDDGQGGSFELTGARISYFDINIATRTIVDGGLAIEAIYDANGERATDNSFTFENSAGFNRFCSAQLVEGGSFDGRGTVDTIYFTGEETGGEFSGVGGGEWALDVATGDLWALPAMGRGAWENVTQVDTGRDGYVAFILSDDTSPFDADGDGDLEAAPLFLYVGEKDTSPDASFLARNGLEGGKLYVWVSNNEQDNPSTFNGTVDNNGKLNGSWVEIDNSQNPDESLWSENGSTGYDEFGYPTQKNLWLQAAEAGAFQFSRPEDVSTNPSNGSEFVLSSTGVSDAFGGADTVGTVYTMDLKFTEDGVPKDSKLNILYDGDADPTQALRSPDNLDWADDGYIYVQEDRAVSGLFGGDAVNQNEASILRIDPRTGEVERVAEINRDAVPFNATDEAPTDVGNWESSGILDVSTLFGEGPGTLFLYDVQAHSIDDQNRFTTEGPAADITDGNLREGGQLGFLEYTVAEDDTGPDYGHGQGHGHGHHDGGAGLFSWSDHFVHDGDMIG